MAGNKAIGGLKTAPSITSTDLLAGTVGGNSRSVSGTVLAAYIATTLPALTGDVTSAVGNPATTIAAGAVTLAKMANLAANSILGNNTASAAAPVALTATQVKSLLGLGTAATVNTGTSGAAIPLLNGANTWSALQTFSAGVSIASGQTLDWNSDTFLQRDAAANVLALRNGVNAQKFSVYNTFTDTSNYERGIFDWAGSSNVLSIGTEAAGSGSTRNLRFIVGGVSLADYGISSSGAWTFIPGSSGTVFKNGVRASNSTGGSDVSISFVGVGYIQAVAAGRIGFTPSTDPTAAADTFFTRGAAAVIGINGTTSSFPALKRSAAALAVRLADDSGDAALTAGAITAMNGTAIPAGGTAGAGLMVSSTANFGVFFGSGAPTLSAAKGSLYLRSDATTNVTRAYINTDGSTTWTGINTVA